jgi:methylenetetrahydrofolate reductase (NADPH)
MLRDGNSAGNRLSQQVNRVREFRAETGRDLTVTEELTGKEREALICSVRDSYLEIFPTKTIESKLDVLEPGSYVAVTCSPTKGVDETLDMSERLAERGFKVVPHIAARMVRNKTHLREIFARIDRTSIISLFVPGGDAGSPVGEYSRALDLLRDMADIDHKFTEIGIAAHPEGHPIASDEELIEQLLAKQEYANYLVTQMCFDAARVDTWLREIRERGVHLPAWIGMPGAADRNSLIKTSLRIGVGDSVRFLKRQGKKAAHLMASSKFVPDRLQFALAPTIANPDLKVDGQHVFCFNQVEESEKWRHDFIESIGNN